MFISNKQCSFCTIAASQDWVMKKTCSTQNQKILPKEWLNVKPSLCWKSSNETHDPTVVIAVKKDAPFSDIRNWRGISLGTTRLWYWNIYIYIYYSSWNFANSSWESANSSWVQTPENRKAQIKRPTPIVIYIYIYHNYIIYIYIYIS